MLKSLELFGFKSFADRTTFEFAEGITCVVGPNGSGKSNVVDAIKWILGDQSPKSLRGKEMSDVIFNGAAGRKPSAFAEATLVFDNTQGLFPIAASEVQIGRRLYASGDSEYLLNRSAVRLKDVRDVMLGTGAGTAAYSIIEQGRVDQILQANPATRRVVFEEAAGISRFKARRVEAERRLERVDQNLLRLQDIVDELEARLNATRSQASKAAKFRELSAELQELWTGLAADDYRAAHAEQSQCELEASQLRASLIDIDRELGQLEQQARDAEARVTGHDHELRQIERRRSSVREEIAGHESTLRHLSNQHQDVASEIERVQFQRHILRRQLNVLGVELQQSSTRLEAFREDFEQQQNALQERRERIEHLRVRLREAREHVEQQRADYESRLQVKAGIERELASAQARQESLASKAQEFVERRTALEAHLLENRAELAERRQALHEAEQTVANSQQEIDRIRAERRRLKGISDDVDERIAAWRETRSTKLGRRQLLEDLEERQEGMTQGVKAILRRAAASSKPPWNQIRGTVGDLLMADLDDAPLLEVALGTRVQLLVIENLSPMIRYLNSAVADISGRVGFLELASKKNGRSSRAEEGARMNVVDLRSEPGVVCRADELVSQSEAPGLAEVLLSETWVVETLGDALRLAAEGSPRQRFVTRQGELLEVDGTLFVGHAAHELQVISRKSELRQLRVELQELDRQIAAEAERQQELNDTLAASDGELQGWESALQSQLEALAIRKTEHASQAAECGRIHAEIDAARSQLQQLAEIQEEINSHQSQLLAKGVEEGETLETLQREIAEREEIAASVETEVQQLHQESNAEQLQLAKYEERLSALQAAELRLLNDQKQQQQHASRTESEMAKTRRRLQDVERTILHTRSKLATLYLSGEALAASVRAKRKQLDECRSLRRQLQQSVERLRERRRAAEDELHKLDIRSRDLAHQLASLEERIREEYQLSLPELVAAGVSARTAWLSMSGGQSDESVHPDESQGDFPIEQHPLTEAVDASDDLIEFGSEAQDNEAPLPAAVRAEIEARIDRLRRKLKTLGTFNPDSLQDLDDLESRYTELSGQLEDLRQAKSTLEDIIRRINVESRRLFLETFESIRVHFQELYRKLFGGGEGNIILEDPDDVLESGIDIVARPPGKELRSISLLSGGEKTMTAVALLFAMFRSKPSPYCILDEVDAALDDANVERYANIVKEFRATTQFVIITHRKRTMTAADRLFGVTMEQAGVSKRLTVRFEDVSEDGHFRTNAAAA